MCQRIRAASFIKNTASGRGSGLSWLVEFCSPLGGGEVLPVPFLLSSPDSKLPRICWCEGPGLVLAVPFLWVWFLSLLVGSTPHHRAACYGFGSGFLCPGIVPGVPRPMCTSFLAPGPFLFWSDSMESGLSPSCLGVVVGVLPGIWVSSSGMGSMTIGPSGLFPSVGCGVISWS